MTRNSEGGAPVWSIERSWFETWKIEHLPGKVLDTETTDEGEFKCRLRDEVHGAGREDESDGHDEPSEPDDADTDPMDAETVAGTDAEHPEKSEDESDVSEVCNDDAHRFLQSAFMAWRIGAFNSQAPYRVLWCFYFWFRVMA